MFDLAEAVTSLARAGGRLTKYSGNVYGRFFVPELEPNAVSNVEGGVAKPNGLATARDAPFSTVFAHVNGMRRTLRRNALFANLIPQRLSNPNGA
jgi:hypothetical protein